jgi:hypothetical protein
MAIVVDVVAIPYILYVTWDEYTGKPLGLRSPKAKIRLVLLDLFFIIFESANLALAFAALTDDKGSCRAGNNGYNYIICNRVKALCGILMIALIAWSLTFAVSIFRYEAPPTLLLSYYSLFLGLWSVSVAEKKGTRHISGTLPPVYISFCQHRKTDRHA